jgi:hypothetical protein
VPDGPELGLTWTDPDFPDTGWLAGTTGVGYEGGTGYEDLIGLDVQSEMAGIVASVFIRVDFDIEDPALFTNLTLRMKYDDGFVAFLNGEGPVASRNAPSAGLEWNSTSTANHSDAAAVVFETIDLPASALSSLRAGKNVLAIQGLNTSVGSSDFLILPELVSVTAADQDGIPITTTTHVKARAYQGGNWSALNEATFVPDSELPLRVTELMYHPLPAGEGSPFEAEDFEFVELQNIGVETLSLNGIRFVEGITYDFSTGEIATLAPGGYVVIVRNLDAFSQRYDAAAVPIAGAYSGRLSNGGEHVKLVDALGDPIQEFIYDDDWHSATDGAGFSLVVVNALAPLEDWSLARGWRESGVRGGSPGAEDVGPGAGGRQLPGDFNQDVSLDVSDPIALLVHLFKDPTRDLPCGDRIDDEGNLALLDYNGDAVVDLSDVIGVLSFLFKQGVPHALGPQCVRIPGCPDVCH